MAPSRSTFYLLYALCFLFLRPAAAQGPSIEVAYCATVNTAEMDPFVSNFQSEGRCFENCTITRTYALAIVQGFNCWCSNIVPNSADEKSADDCSNPCPGYPSDWCGGADTFGYLAAKNHLPSKTAGGKEQSPTTSSSSSSAIVTIETETVQSTIQNTVTLVPPVTLAPPVTLVSESSSSTSDSPTTSPTQDPNTDPVVQTVTVGGEVKTVTATPSPTGSGSSALADSSKSSGVSTAAAVGIGVGVGGGLLVAGLFLWFLIVKRRRAAAENDVPFGLSSGKGSASGMMGTPATGEMSDNRFAPGSSGADEARWEAERKRRSHLMVIDPRLDHKGVFMAHNTSRETVGSFQDHQDYSRRVLRATNPDPDDD
ncbi:hypothetical protein B0H66DRAFT_609116 [Apodospora peruviana]|uniref:WSC domain-containing protein n=1 Tax=Apodospora peruviana TaxID=516989 RepID=A0AAE0HS74_9PEZI|nr:hypothetical protein B0H66DRAFT_609116 [Apodospora peruviana]